MRTWHSQKNYLFNLEKHTEQITNEKLSMVKAKPDVKTLEEQLHRGQIEEVILQAENKLSLGRKMVRWKSQESLVEEPPANQWKWLPQFFSPLSIFLTVTNHLAKNILKSGSSAPGFLHLLYL